MKRCIWLILFVLIVPVCVWGEFTPGNLYVLGWNNRKVLEYDRNWTLISSWGHPAFEGQNIGGMTFDAEGNLVVAASAKFCVFSAPGVEVGCYPSNTYERLENIIFDNDGNLYTTTSSYGSPMVRKYDKDYHQVASFPMPSGSLTGITCDVDQNLYVASQNAGAIYKVDRVSGSILDTILGLRRSAYGIEGIQITHNGDLLVAEYATGVLRIDPSSPLKIYDTIAAPSTNWPVPVTIDNEGRIYAGDFENGYGSRPADLFTWDADGKLLSSRISSEVYGPFGMVVAGVTLPCGAFRDSCVDQGGDADHDGICDNLPPIADAGDDQVVSCTENKRGEVSLSGARSISPEGLPLSFNWSGPFGTALGETPLVSLQLGSNEVSLLVEDVNGETAQDSVVVSVVDDAPPVTNDNISGVPGDNGWYRSAVTVTLTASDHCSEIKEIHYSVNDGPINIASGNNVSFAVTTDGIYTVTYYAIDKSGMAESPTTLNFKIDKTPPVITAIPSPSANSFGWYNTDVNVVFDAIDDMSGIENYSPPVLISSEGISQIYTGTAYDRAGNSSSTSVVINIDKSAPSATLDATPGELWPPNHKMVKVFLEGGAVDTVSGIDSVVFSLIDEYGVIKDVPSGFNTFIRLEAWREGADVDGRHYTVKAIITDRAGNIFTSSSVVTVPHDMRL